jgi:hypothetical protein
MWWLAVVCFLPPVCCLILFALQPLLLQAGILNTEDLTIAAGRRGTLSQELLNVWTWDAAIGLLCLLSFLALPVGVLFVMAARSRPNRHNP